MTAKFTLKSTFVSVIAGALIVSVAVSSLVIVPVAVAVLVMAAIWVAVVSLTAPRFTVNVSLASTTVSPLIVTDTSCDLAHRAREVQRGRVQRVVRAARRAVGALMAT